LFCPVFNPSGLSVSSHSRTRGQHTEMERTDLDDTVQRILERRRARRPPEAARYSQETAAEPQPPVTAPPPARAESPTLSSEAQSVRALEVRLPPHVRPRARRERGTSLASSLAGHSEAVTEGSHDTTVDQSSTFPYGANAPYSPSQPVPPLDFSRGAGPPIDAVGARNTRVDTHWTGPSADSSPSSAWNRHTIGLEVPLDDVPASARDDRRTVARELALAPSSAPIHARVHQESPLRRSVQPLEPLLSGTAVGSAKTVGPLAQEGFVGSSSLCPALPLVGMGGQEAGIARFFAPLVEQARSLVAPLYRGGMLVYLRPDKSLGEVYHVPVRVWVRVEPSLRRLVWTEMDPDRPLMYASDSTHPGFWDVDPRPLPRGNEWTLNLRDIALVSCGGDDSTATSLGALLRREGQTSMSIALAKSLFSLAIPSFELPVEFLAQNPDHRADWTAGLALLCSLLPEHSVDALPPPDGASA
jgi:hypothetical protein